MRFPVPAFIASVAFEHLAGMQSVNEAIRSFSAPAAEFLRIVSVIAAGVVFANEAINETLKEYITPKIISGLQAMKNETINEINLGWENKISPWAKENIDLFRVDIIEMFKNKDLNFTFDRVEYSKTYDQNIKNRLTRDVDQDSQEIDAAFRLMLDGRSQQALVSLERLAKQNPNNTKHLILGLAMMPSAPYWERARKLLPAAGEPQHYRRLALSYWAHDKVDVAVSLAEAGYELACRDGDPDEDTRYQLRNSLAYYYAEAGRKDKAADALLLSEQEVARRKSRFEKQPELSVEYADALDTAGFVKIVFGGEAEIEAGIKQCAEACSLGATFDLFFEHIEIGKSKLASLRISPPAS